MVSLDPLLGLSFVGNPTTCLFFLSQIELSVMLSLKWMSNTYYKYNFNSSNMNLKTLTGFYYELDHWEYYDLPKYVKQNNYEMILHIYGKYY